MEGVGQNLLEAVEKCSVNKARDVLFGSSVSYFDSYWADPNLDHSLDKAYMRACKGYQGKEDDKAMMRLLLQEGLDPMALLDDEGLEMIDPTFELSSAEDEMAFFKGWYQSLLDNDFSYCRVHWGEGKAPLDDAATAGFDDVVEALLKMPGTMVNHQDANGHSALHECLHNPQVTRLLLSHPMVDPNLTCESQCTPLMMGIIRASEQDGAKRVAYKQSLELLLRHPLTQVNLTDKNGWTALMWACECGDHDAISLLLSHPDVNVNFRDQDGNTSLMIACDHKDEKAVSLLLQRVEIDVDIRNDTRLTALDVAYRQSEGRIIEMLESKGAATRANKSRLSLKGNRRYR